jgi:hypothetical protein
VSTTIVGGGRDVVLIFGFGQGQGQDLGEVAPIACPRCHNEVFLHHVHSDKKFSLYFVPVATYATNEYLACPICQHGVQLSDTQRSFVAGMRTATDAHRRGQVTDDVYGIEVARFWTRMGIAAPPAAATPASVASRPAAPPAPARPGAPAPPPARASPPPVAPPPSSWTDEIARLAELHRAGVLTDEEFAAAKARVLRR